MQKTCRNTWCKSVFELHPDDQAFHEKIAFRFGDTVVHPPELVHCPQCRMLRRTCHRNERTLYRSKSSKSGRDIISLYAPRQLWGAETKVYEQEEWRADDFDALQYGREFDFSRTFFEQFSELLKAVPRMNLITVSNDNSPYTTGTGFCRNCYLINSSENCEDCYHGKLLQTCKDCVDCSYLYTSELCYQCFSVFGSYNCQYLLFSKNCHDCFFSSNLSACSNCLLCTNLSQKEYHYLNKPLTKEEYESRLQKFRGSRSSMQKMYMELLRLRSNTPQKYANILNSEGCSGDYIENSKHCTDCFDVTGSEDCRNVQVGVNVKDNFDCSNMYLNVEQCYEVLGAIEVFNAAYCIFVFHSQNLLYCDLCFNCSDCFACSGLTRKRHCIFNKEYTEQQYNALVPKIIEHMRRTPHQSPAGSSTGQAGEWGEYFPTRYAPFGYNESLAFEYVPLTKEEATRRGYLWRDDIDQPIQMKKVIPGVRLPDTISEVPDDILDWAITCEATGRPFKIISQELDFYRRCKLPTPSIHPDERHRIRMMLRNPRKLWSRKCAKCGLEVLTTYSLKRPEIVWCERCYAEAVY